MPFHAKYFRHSLKIFSKLLLASGMIWHGTFELLSYLLLTNQI